MFITLKFGGTSVATKGNWDKIASILRDRQQQEKNSKLIIVCSALAGISNLLERVVAGAREGHYKEILEEVKRVHLDLLKEMDLPFDDTISSDWEQFEKIILGISLLNDYSPKVHARVLSFGEIFSTKIGTQYLKKLGEDVQWLDAREYLLANDDQGTARSYLCATCKVDQNERLITDCKARVIITQGFIAKNRIGECVLLGRGGSDVSGAYFAVMSNSKRLEIWSDVPGIFTANPKEISSARLLKYLDYDEAQEIASAGAKVLHPRCIGPVKRASIPLHLYSTVHPEIEGTVISGEGKSDRPQVKAISTKRETILISMNTLGMWQEVGFLSQVFEIFKKRSLSINLISTSESNITVTLDESDNSLNADLLNALKDDLSSICRVEIATNRATISLVGKKIRAILHQLTPALMLFEEHKIYLLSQSSSDLNLACVVDRDQVTRLSSKLHSLLFKDIRNNPLLGLSWDQIFSDQNEFDDSSWQQRWWAQRRKELLTIGEEKLPCYVYNLNEVEKSIANVLSLNSIDQIFYAMKANNNADILRLIEKKGLGFECVSIEEMNYLFELFPKIDSKKILFTPNFSDRTEYKKAFEKGVHVNLDSLYPLENWGDLFRKKEIFIRVDTGIGGGHHGYVNTAGNESKFGIPPYEFEKFKALALAIELKVIGLHAHAGSGIRSFSRWSEIGCYLATLLEHFPEVKTIDMGGGLGVPERFNDSELDTKLMEKSLSALKAEYPQLKFWLEPGRFLVAESGVLLAKVNQLKTKGETNYVGINAGMNVLIRPALYGSYHEIVNLSKLDSAKGLLANIVGPICESGDILGLDRNLAKETAEGDVLLISTSGAYGAVMSSNYTMRGKGREIILEN